MDKSKYLCYTYYMIEEILTNLGLNDKETLVYLTILKNNELSASDIARKTKLKRTTSYAVLDNLIQKRLITKNPNKKVDSYIPLPTSNVAEMFASEERSLNRKKELAKRAALELSQFGSNAIFSIPKTTFIPEEDALDYLYENTEKWNESMAKYDKTLWGFSTPSYSDAFAEYVDWWSRKAENKLQLKLFSSSSKSLSDFSEKYKHRLIKKWPGKPFNTSMTIQGDYVLIESTGTKPFYLIEIYDKVLAENLREMFRTMWGIV